MLVKERMKALGDHAKSSRQPPVKERKYAKADESAAKTIDIDEDIFDNGPAHDGAAAVLVEDVTPQTVVQENGNGASDSATRVETVQDDDDTSAAKRAIIHEWENWSALHSDELGDPSVAEYFFKHLQAKRPQLLNFSSQDKQAIVRSAIGNIR